MRSPAPPRTKTGAAPPPAKSGHGAPGHVAPKPSRNDDDEVQVLDSDVEGGPPPARVPLTPARAPRASSVAPAPRRRAQSLTPARVPRASTAAEEEQELCVP
jgi:hypothetical protein